MPSGVFSVLPDNFFNPLTSINRKHYAALLVLYYRLFQENTKGLEREVVIREFMNYLALNLDSLTEENDESNETVFFNSPPDLNFDNPKQLSYDKDERQIASRMLRTLIDTGWLGEETLADFTKAINITAYGKPFIKALADVDNGLKTEYESHIVTIYSMLCQEDSIKRNGHIAVLKAHEECRSLIDALKVLSQSIKSYWDSLNNEAIRTKASSVLHEHYNLYMGEVLDKAYKRLKTSDNVSRYRQKIFSQVSSLLRDKKWLDESAEKYRNILQKPREDCREKLELMLNDIRDDLKSIDPLEDEIDRRNAAYSRSSTEIIKAYIEPDSTIAGKIGSIIKAIKTGDKTTEEIIEHHLYRIKFLSPSTLTFIQRREEGSFNNTVSISDLQAVEQREKEFRERMKKRLSIRKIALWLDDQGGKENALVPNEIIKDEESYVRFIYSLLYGDSRSNFDYSVEEESGSVKAADYIVPDIRFRRKNYESGY